MNWEELGEEVRRKYELLVDVVEARYPWMACGRTERDGYLNSNPYFYSGLSMAWSGSDEELFYVEFEVASRSESNCSSEMARSEPGSVKVSFDVVFAGTNSTPGDGIELEGETFSEDFCDGLLFDEFVMRYAGLAMAFLEDNIDFFLRNIESGLEGPDIGLYK